MTRHDAPSIDLHAFVSTAEVQALKQFIAIFIPNKDIHPIDGSEADKVETFLVIELVFPAHSVRSWPYWI